MSAWLGIAERPGSTSICLIGNKTSSGTCLLLMKPGVYEVTVADMLLPALSHALGLDILIFNTFKASRSFSGGNGPLLLSQSDCWGGEASKKPPLLIAYNKVH